MKKRLVFLFGWLTFVVRAQAVDSPSPMLRLFLAPASFVSWEGKGYREVAEGWESKVKDHAFAGGIVYRHSLHALGGLEMRYWSSVPERTDETGITQTPRQSRTSLQNHDFEIAYYRKPSEESIWEWQAGLQGTHQIWSRSEFRVSGAPVAGAAKTHLTALGILLGVGGRYGGRSFIEGEFRVSHYPFSTSNQESPGSAMWSQGYGAFWRFGAGVKLASRWEASAGYLAHLWSIDVDGGRVDPSGIIASYPLNQTTVGGFYVSAGYAF